jgi:hypothetical protein
MAQYAGFFLAAAGVCMASLAGWLARGTAFVTLATIFGGLIVGRLVSLVPNGGLSGYGPTIEAHCSGLGKVWSFLWRILSRFQAVPAAASRRCWQSFDNAASPRSRNRVGGSLPRKLSAVAGRRPG